MDQYKVGYFVGSLASTSINCLLSKSLVRLAPPELAMTEIPIRDLPLDSSDYGADYPPVARAFKQAIADVDAVLFVSPEYNRSIPGGLCFCNSPLMNTVEAYIQFKPGLITADGEVTSDGTRQFLQNYMNEFHAFVARVLTVMPRVAG
jgi:chromate reductase